MQSNLQGAVEKLAALEKQTRQVSNRRSGTGSVTDPLLGLRSGIDLTNPHRNRYTMQECGRLELAERADFALLQEAQPAEAGHHQDGTDRYGLPRRHTGSQDQAIGY